MQHVESPAPENLQGYFAKVSDTISTAHRLLLGQCTVLLLLFAVTEYWIVQLLFDLWNNAKFFLNKK